MELQNTYPSLLDQIKSTYTKGKASAIKAAGREMVLTYWAVGRHIVAYEQSGNEKAEYGSKILERLSRDLSHQLGRGFDRSRLIYMRLLFLKYPEPTALSHQLTWSHLVELLKIDHDLERSFYEKQAILEKWTVRELKRQKNSALFLRLAAAQDKSGVLQLAEKGNMVERPEDLLRDPYVFEFLKIPEPYHLSEKDLESRLLDKRRRGGFSYRRDVRPCVSMSRVSRGGALRAGVNFSRGLISRRDAETQRCRLGEFLKELELTEGRATGIPTILKALKDNGSPAPRFLTHSDYSFFEVELFIHPSFVSKTPIVLDLDTMVWDIHGIDELLERLLLGIDEGVSGDIANDRAKTTQKFDNLFFKIKDALAGDTVGDIAGGISGGIAEKMIQVLLWAGTPIERKELLKAIGLSGNVKNYNTYIAPLVAINWLTMTIPDKPTSPNQKYLTTLKGRLVLSFLNRRLK